VSTMSAPRRRRLAPVAVLSAVLAVAGCATFEAPAVMTVNGTEVSEAALDEELDLVEESEEYRTLLEQQLGTTSAGSGRGGTVDTDFVANLLTERVYFSLVEDELVRREVDVGDRELRAATDQLEAQANQSFDALEGEPRRRLARRVALLTALQEEVLPAYFEEHADEFDALCVSHVLVSTEGRTEAEASARVDDLRVQLDAGASFDVLASEQSDDATAAQQGGDLGCGGPERFAPAFGEAASALEVGEVSDPVQTEFGFHLIRRDEATFEAAQAEVQQRFLVEASEAADVEVNPRYGRWVTGEGAGPRVVPPGSDGATAPGR
jgi:parvulin-like peptidyl-prolyl isomerase